MQMENCNRENGCIWKSAIEKFKSANGKLETGNWKLETGNPVIRYENFITLAY
jgi:hypothetical protein